MAEPPGSIPDWCFVQHLDAGEQMLLDRSATKVKFGLAWESQADVDGSVMLFDDRQSLCDTVWYRQLKSRFPDAVQHSGDDRTGEGSGDDEKISIKLRKLPPNVAYVVCCISVFSASQSLASVRKVRLRLYHGSKKPKKSGRILVQFDLDHMRVSGRSMLVAVLARQGPWWSLRALAKPAGQWRQASDVARNERALLGSVFAGLPASLPARFCVTVTVRAGRGLAAKDVNGLADPFVTLQYRKLRSKSDVVRKTLAPDWVGGGGKPASVRVEGVDVAEAKKLKLGVWDWNRFTSSDFMGHLKIPLGALANLGPGRHTLEERLQTHPKKYPSSSVSGTLVLDVAVEPFEAR